MEIKISKYSDKYFFDEDYYHRYFIDDKHLYHFSNTKIGIYKINEKIFLEEYASYEIETPDIILDFIKSSDNKYICLMQIASNEY